MFTICTINCPNCGAGIEYLETEDILVCLYCKTKVLLLGKPDGNISAGRYGQIDSIKTIERITESLKRLMTVYQFNYMLTYLDVRKQIIKLKNDYESRMNGVGYIFRTSNLKRKFEDNYKRQIKRFSATFSKCFLEKLDLQKKYVNSKLEINKISENIFDENDDLDISYWGDRVTWEEFKESCSEAEKGIAFEAFIEFEKFCRDNPGLDTASAKLLKEGYKKGDIKKARMVATFDAKNFGVKEYFS